MPQIPARVRRWVVVALRAGYLLYLAARDKRVPMLARAIAAACAAYVISPIDLIPDEIPVIGEFDDAAVAAFGVVAVRRLIPAPLLAELRAKAADRFPETKAVPVVSHRTLVDAPRGGLGAYPAATRLSGPFG